MKKYILVTIALAVLSACTTKQPVNNGIVIWHWMTDRHAEFEELSEKYEKLTGIPVTFELYAPTETYSQKIRAAGQTSSLPDIFGILYEKKDFASFIKAGHVADLTKDMEDMDNQWKHSFFSKALMSNSFSEGNEYEVTPGYYGVPIDITNIQMLYNKRIFTASGLDPSLPPKTWDEFLKYSRKIKKAGYPVFVSGFGETWFIENFALNYAVNIMGLDKVLDTFRGKVLYTDKDWVKVFELFKTMYKKELIIPNIVSMVNKVSEQTFAMEKAAFTFNGSWCVNVYKVMNPDLDYMPMLPPKLDPEKEMVIWGGSGTSFVVNEKSSKKEKAIEFLKWLTDVDQQVFLSEGTFNLPSNKASLTSIANPVLKKFAEGMFYTTHPSIWPVQEDTRVQEVMARGIQQILTGEKTSEEVAAMVAKIKSTSKRKK